MNDKKFAYLYVASGEKMIDRIINFPNVIVDDPEDFKYCVNRESYNEIVSALKFSIPVYIIAFDSNKLSHRIEVKSYNEDGTLEYEEKDNVGQLIVMDWVFVRGGITQIDNFIKWNKDFSIPVINEPIESIDYWYRKYSFLTKRWIAEVYDRGHDDLQFPIDQLAPIFVKSINKDVSMVYNSPEDMMGIYNILNGGNYLVSQYMDIDEDEYGKKEYRVWVINNIIVGISRYKDYESIEIPEKITMEAQRLTSIVKEDTYVLDLCILTNGNIDIVEFNNLASSGRYIDINPDNIMSILIGRELQTNG